MRRRSAGRLRAPVAIELMALRAVNRPLRSLRLLRELRVDVLTVWRGGQDGCGPAGPVGGMRFAFPSYAATPWRAGLFVGGDLARGGHHGVGDEAGVAANR